MENFVKENWFKLIIGVVLLSLVYIGYQYYYANGLKQCAEFGAKLDDQFKKETENGGVTRFVTSNYRFKNNACYREVEYLNNITGERQVLIENPFTHEVIATCSMDNKHQPVVKEFCDKYYDSYNKIFEKIY